MLSLTSKRGEEENHVFSGLPMEGTTFAGKCGCLWRREEAAEGSGKERLIFFPCLPFYTFEF